MRRCVLELPRILLIFLATSVDAGALEATPQTLATTFFDVRADANFTNFKTVVLAYARARPAMSRTKACVLGQENSDKTRTSWIILNGAHRIISWDGGGEPLEDSRRSIDLRRDVVASESDIHGSSFLVTTAWVQELNQNCLRYGVLFEVGRNKSTRERR